ncbi:MAG TPA: hypothetical protein VFZ57_00230, partial [Thermoanaerobaculia bacterium]|nr:hypothetical protein [Thermoanaerobaculia bacterium]
MPPRPDWAELILRRRAEARGLRPKDWLGSLRKAAGGRIPDWASLVRRLSRRMLAEGKGRKLEAVAAFRNRLDGLLLSETRQAAGLGSFLGGRIALFPHQLHVAESATAWDPVR